MTEDLTMKVLFFFSCSPFSMSFKEQLLAENLFARGHEIIIIKLISLLP